MFRINNKILFIQNTRRDSQYIAKINKLEKQLLVCSKECTQLDDTLKSTKTKVRFLQFDPMIRRVLWKLEFKIHTFFQLDSIEDESFGSNEMVASLKADLEASKVCRQNIKNE